MAATTTSGFLPRATASVMPTHRLPSTRRRRIDRQPGRALEILSHAIEYLVDEYRYHGIPLAEGEGHLHPVQLLAALNREIYAACPQIPTFAERCTAWMCRFEN